jgi:hypothetical protein
MRPKSRAFREQFDFWNQKMKFTVIRTSSNDGQHTAGKQLATRGHNLTNFQKSKNLEIYANFGIEIMI